MGRKIEAVTGARDWYVPDIEDNRKDPDPFRVLISQPNGADYKKLEGEHLGAVTGGKINWMERAQDTVRDLFTKYVHEVQQYSVTDAKTGAVIEPQNGKTLFEAIQRAPASEEAVVNDIMAALKDSVRLKEGLLAGLRSQSGSSTPMTGSPGAGAASDAGAKIEAPSPSVPTPIVDVSATATPS